MLRPLNAFKTKNFEYGFFWPTLYNSCCCVGLKCDARMCHAWVVVNKCIVVIFGCEYLCFQMVTRFGWILHLIWSWIPSVVCGRGFDGIVLSNKLIRHHYLETGKPCEYQRSQSGRFKSSDWVDNRQGTPKLHFHFKYPRTMSMYTWSLQAACSGG